MTTATASDLAINGGTPVFESNVPFMAVGLTKKDIAAANEVLESGMLRAASKCAALEEKFAEASDANRRTAASFVCQRCSWNWTKSSSSIASTATGLSALMMVVPAWIVVG